MTKKNENIKTYRGELALLIVVLINSFGVVLMLHSGSGISAISSVPYAFSEVFPTISLGTWTYIFQALLIAGLLMMRREFVPQYLLSFVVGFAFSIFIDIHKAWIGILPQTLPLQVLYFAVSYLILAFGIALSNRCRMPIVPTDLFPRELSSITSLPYSRVKVPFEVICLATTALMTWLFLGEIRGLGIGTVAAAFTLGKAVEIIGDWMDRHMTFVSFLEPTPDTVKNDSSQARTA